MSEIDKSIMDSIKEDALKEPKKKTRTRVAKPKEPEVAIPDGSAKVTKKTNGCTIIDY